MILVSNLWDVRLFSLFLSCQLGNQYLVLYCIVLYCIILYHIILYFYFLVGLGSELKALCLSHTFSAFLFPLFFEDRVSQASFLGWPQTLILQISASQATRITGMSHQCPPVLLFCYFLFIIILLFYFLLFWG
jgi:hypothetical protein